MKGGYTGKIARVSLTDKSVSTIPTEKYVEFGGGHGIGSAIFFDLVGDQLLPLREALDALHGGQVASWCWHGAGDLVSGDGGTRDLDHGADHVPDLPHAVLLGHFLVDPLDDGSLVGRTRVGRAPITAAPRVVGEVLYVLGDAGELAAMTAPDAPIKVALMANVIIFTLVTLTPVWAAASSYSPMLCKASPNLEFLIR